MFSSQNNPELNITEDQFPMILDFDLNDEYYLGMLVDLGFYRKTFIIKKKDLLAGKKNWKLLSEPDDKVKNLELVKGNGIFLSSYNTYFNKLCKVDLNKPDFKNAIVLVPEKKHEIIKSFRITKDGIYYNYN